MSALFKKAFRIYLILLILVSIAFWVYMVHDDWVFVEKYGMSWEKLGGWFVWYFAYCFIGFTFWYWIPVSAGIFIYKRLLRR
ncbi:MAG: hypothetical protein ACK5XV_07670 [Flavobacteriales bacterium]